MEMYRFFTDPQIKRAHSGYRDQAIKSIQHKSSQLNFQILKYLKFPAPNPLYCEVFTRFNKQG